MKPRRESVLKDQTFSLSAAARLTVQSQVKKTENQTPREPGETEEVTD